MPAEAGQGLADPLGERAVVTGQVARSDPVHRVRQVGTSRVTGVVRVQGRLRGLGRQFFRQALYVDMPCRRAPVLSGSFLSAPGELVSVVNCRVSNFVSESHGRCRMEVESDTEMRFAGRCCT